MIGVWGSYNKLKITINVYIYITNFTRNKGVVSVIQDQDVK